MPHPDDVEPMESASAQRRTEYGQVMTLDEAPASAAVAFQSRPLVSHFARLRTHDDRTLPGLSGDRHAMRNSLDPCTPRTIGQIKHHLSSISSLLGPFLAPREELESLQGEVEMWKKRWEQCQMEITSLRSPLEVRRGMDGVPNKAMDFGVVLIDGNSLIFHDHFLQLGFQGGTQAARILLSSLPILPSSQSLQPATSHTASVRSSHDLYPSDRSSVSMENSLRFRKGSTEFEVVFVEFFVNKPILGSALVKAGLVPSLKVYDAFWRGLCAEYELINVIDVAPGAKAVESKIREHLSFYSGVNQCGLIVLGGPNHDFDPILTALHAQARLPDLLLLTTSLDHHIRNPEWRFDYRVASIPDLFRLLPLIPAEVPYSKKTASQDGFDTASGSALGAAEDKASATKHDIEGNQAQISAHQIPSAEEQASNDSVVARSLHVSQESAFARQDEGAWREPNRGRRHGASETKDAGVAASVRTLNPRPCHMHYLGSKKCKAGDDCKFAHNYDLNPSQVDELSRLAKRIVCPHIAANRCHYTAEDCLYGHVCPDLRDCSFGEACRFKCLPNGHGEVDLVVERSGNASLDWSEM